MKMAVTIHLQIVVTRDLHMSVTKVMISELLQMAVTLLLGPATGSVGSFQVTRVWSY